MNQDLANYIRAFIPLSCMVQRCQNCARHKIRTTRKILDIEEDSKVLFLCPTHYIMYLQRRLGRAAWLALCGPTWRKIPAIKMLDCLANGVSNRFLNGEPTEKKHG